MTTDHATKSHLCRKFRKFIKSNIRNILIFHWSRRIIRGVLEMNKASLIHTFPFYKCLFLSLITTLGCLFVMCLASKPLNELNGASGKWSIPGLLPHYLSSFNRLKKFNLLQSTCFSRIYSTYHCTNSMVEFFFNMSIVNGLRRIIICI